MEIQLAEKLTLPADAVTQVFSFMGRRGSGLRLWSVAGLRDMVSQRKQKARAKERASGEVPKLGSSRRT